MNAPAPCTACGGANPAGSKFCNECGSPLAGGGGHEARKTLTVLFADLVGFTSLGERLDQESLRRVMDRFYEEMRGAVHAHGGTVAKFIGDAVMAVWGTPVVREDDALRAVRAAEEMRGALAALNLDLEHRWGVRVGMRTGVNTGEVVVDPSKPADLLVGDTLNVAARLEQAAGDGEILAGPETYRLARDQATFEPVEPLRLKGKARRLAAYRLVDGTQPERRRAERLRAPLVGREAELGRLRAGFDAAVQAGETRLVTVVGSPGVGKSRLAHELAARLDGEARVLRGHCEPATEGATFLPVAEVLRSAPPIEEATLEPRVLDAVAAVLGEGPLVAAEETFWAVRRFLEALARERPLVVVLDDVHWGEPTFLDLVEHLAGWGRDGPILVLALARPELRDTRPALTDPGAVAYDSLDLEPLAPEASRALVDGLLGAADLPEQLADRLLETADGNPLFLGEMLRMLVDDGVLRREGGAWVLDEAERVSVPPTIHALLAARLEGLPAAERTVAEHAAVIGPLFTRAAVAELTGEPLASTLDVQLQALRRKELITGAEGESFRFGHALIRDAAYRRLLKDTRAELHERFAGWLEASGAEHDEIVASHLERAYRYRRELGPLDAAARDVGRRAGERLREAGRHALAREDLPAATSLLTRALHVVEADDAIRSEALLDLAEALLSAGDTARGEQVVDELGLRAEEARDARLAAYATVFGGHLANLMGAGGVRETIALVAQAADALAAAGDAAGQAKAHHVIAAAHALLGEVAAAEAALDRALGAARAADDRRRVTAVLSGAPRAALWGPSPVVRASGRCLDVVRIVRLTPGNRHVETVALRCQAVLEAMRGRAAAGREILRDGRAVLEELGLTLELHELDTYAGTVELLAGEPAAAEEHLRAARDGFAALGVDTGAAQAAALLGRAVLEQGRDDEAIALTEFAEHHGGEDLKTAIAWRGVRAEALARRGEHDDARRLAHEAVAMAEPTDALADKADALMALVAVLRGGGDEDGARDVASRARDLYAAKEHEVGLARAGGVVATPQPAAAAALGDSPSERLGAEWVRRINARDFEALRETFCEEFRLIDHRPAGADTDGPDALIASLTSIVDLVPDYEWRFAKLLAASDTVMAYVLELAAESVAGGGPVVLGLGGVATLANGRMATVELFEPDDEAAILERYDELHAEAAESPGERFLHEFTRRINARDWDGVRELYDPAFRLIDHRAPGADMDLDQLIAGYQDASDLVPDVRWERTRVLAAGEAITASIMEFKGHFRDGGGPVAQAYGSLGVRRGGLVVRIELFDGEDDAAILARYHELVAEDDPARLAPGIRPDHPVVVIARAFCAAFDVDDGTWESLIAEDYVAVDRRPVGWGRRIDREQVLETRASARQLAPDMRETLEVLAVGDDLLAGALSHRGHTTEGGGLIDIALAMVVAFEDGREIYEEYFEPDDRAAVLARFDELLVERAATPGRRIAAEYLRRFHARDWAGVRAIFADDMVHVDHRTVGLWEADGPDDVTAQLRRLTEDIPDVRIGIEVIAEAGDVVARRSTWAGTYGGGTMEAQAGQVAVHRDGRVARIEQFDPDDEEALLARFHELRAEADPVRLAPGIPSDHPAVASARAEAAAFHLDDDTWAARFAPGYAAVDRRPIGWGEKIDREFVLETRASVRQLAPDMRESFEVIAVADDLFARIPSFRGHSTEGGGQVDITFGAVGAIEDGRLVYEEYFDSDDRAAILARFDELLVERATTPGRRIAAEHLRRFHARDWDGLREGYADDLVHEDRRSLRLWQVDGPDEIVAHLRYLAEHTRDIRMHLQILAESGGVLAGRVTFAGTSRGSPHEVQILEVDVVRDGRVARIEAFDPDDEAAMLARFEELRAEAEPVRIAPDVFDDSAAASASFNARAGATGPAADQG